MSTLKSNAEFKMKAQYLLITIVLFSSFNVSTMAKTEYDVTIGTRYAQLRYSPEVFAVKPGSKVRLTLSNSDEMIHNLVLAKGNSKEMDRLAEAALKLGEKGMEMGFVPKDPSIITSIGLVKPGQKSSVEFIAPEEKGDYPFVCTFPGHSLTMRGVMKVVDEPSLVNLAEIKMTSAGTTPKNGVLEVGNEARVIRVHISGVDSGRSIAVGLPGGFNYLFDAEKLMVRTGWTGAFLNVSRDRRSRGGGPCSILGKKFEVGSEEYPLRIGKAEKRPSVRFRGYSKLGNPVFYYDVDGVQVSQTATGSPDKEGLTYGFRITNAPADLFFLVNQENLKVTTTAGEWKPDKGYVHIPADESAEFFVSIERK